MNSTDPDETTAAAWLRLRPELWTDDPDALVALVTQMVDDGALKAARKNATRYLKDAHFFGHIHRIRRIIANLRLK